MSRVITRCLTRYLHTLILARVKLNCSSLWVHEMAGETLITGLSVMSPVEFTETSQEKQDSQKIHF